MILRQKKYVVLRFLVSALPLLSFSWGLRWHFKSAGQRMPRKMRVLSQISLASYLSYIGLIIYRHRSRRLNLLPFAAFVGSLSLFWWTVKVTRQRRLLVAHTNIDPDSIHSSGPYAYVRHPFYVAYIIFWVTTALDAGTWQWIPAIGLTIWYMLTARKEERRFGSTGLRLAYEAYRQRTGMLIPKWASLVGRRTAEVSHRTYDDRNREVVH